MRSEGNGNNNSSRSRLPTWTEMENNRRRERRRRAIASKIYAGLRAHGNYKLHKHCDNNEVLKALCREAGWTVEDDGTTYRNKGCKPAEQVDVVGSASPCSSYQPSPFASYNPSPSSSSFPSPKRSCNINSDCTGDESLLPWLKNFSHAAKPPKHNHLYYGSASAPVTPPLSSSPSRSLTITSREATGCTFLPSSSISSPEDQVFPDSGLLGVPISPTFSLISSNKLNPFGSARMWTPGVDVQVASDEFAFGSSSNGTGLLKAWEGERIHGECAPDELELTLGTSKTSLDA